MIQAAQDWPMKMGATVDNKGMVFMLPHILSPFPIPFFVCRYLCSFLFFFVLWRIYRDILLALVPVIRLCDNALHRIALNELWVEWKIFETLGRHMRCTTIRSFIEIDRAMLELFVTIRETAREKKHTHTENIHVNFHWTIIKMKMHKMNACVSSQQWNSCELLNQQC